MADKQFIVDVADIQLRSIESDAVVLTGKTLLNSGLTQAVQSLQIRGGKGSKLLFDYSYQKEISVSIEDCSWRQEYLAIANGTNIGTSLNDYWVFEESVTLTAGAGVVAQTPSTGTKLYVEKADGTKITVTPSGKNFTVAGGLATTVKVSYQYNVSVDSITISANDFPDTYELVMFTEILNSSGKVADVQIIISKFKASGAFDMSFGAGKAATNKLEGKALSDDNENYATILIKPVVASNNFIAIAAYPSAVALSSTATTQQLIVYGVRNNPYSNMVIPVSECTFLSGTTATCTVSAGGLITRAGSGTSVITTTHTATGLTDQITVTSS